jgi:hypothetical protein
MENLNLKEMSLEELEAMKKEISEEIEGRKKNTLVLYAHDCKNASSHHLSKYNHLAKLVRAVDTSQTTGDAFIGEFLNVVAEHHLPVGSIVVEVCDRDVKAYRLTLERKQKIAERKRKSMSSFIKKVAKEFLKGEIR